MPWCREFIEPLMEARGHPLSFLEEELGEGEDSMDTSTPWGLARAYADEGWAWLNDNDGWNADGSMCGREFNRVPFSGDFSMTDSEGNSWTPYSPRNSPYEQDKEVAAADGNRWLWVHLHSRTRDAAHRQHWAVLRFLLERARRSVCFAQAEEAGLHQQVLNRHQGRACFCGVGDHRNRRKQAVRHLLLRQQIQFTHSAQDRLLFAVKVTWDGGSAQGCPTIRDTTAAEYTTADFYQVTLEVQVAIYNSILLAWKEKIRQDRPWPPTMIKHKVGDEMVEAYAGPDEGVQTMKASEWQPFIRTMPHSEYPSGSACNCAAFAAQIKNFLGTDVIEPPLQFPPGLDEPPLEFLARSEIAQVCGDSRTWGGMHFEGAVTAGFELCGGDDMAKSVHDSFERLKAGDESAAIFKKDIGELMVRPRESYRGL